MNTLRSTAILSIASLLAACIGGAGAPEKGEYKATLVQEWFANANFAGELVAMERTAPARGLALTVQEGSYEIDPIKLVLSGQAQFGVAGADKVLAANDKGAGLVIIGVINQDSPTCFLTLASSGITTPAEFKGRKVGVLTGTATEYVYRKMMVRAGVAPSTYTEVEAPFDLNTFVMGVYDVRPAFIYDEPISLEMQGIAFNLIDPVEYGVQMMGPVYFTTRKTMQNQPGMVEAFVHAVAEGWETVLADPDLGIEALMRYAPKADAVRERKSLARGLDLFHGHDDQVLMADDAHIDGTGGALLELGIIKAFDRNALDLRFVRSYHEKKR